MFEWLKGKRTYIAVGVGVVLTGLLGMGLISPDTYEVLAGLAGFLGLGFLRAAK